LAQGFASRALALGTRYLSWRVVRSVTLGLDRSSLDPGAAANSFIRRRICRACHTLLKPLPKKKKAGIRSSSQSQLVTADGRTLSKMAGKKNPSPMKKHATPVPVSSSGSFCAMVASPAPPRATETVGKLAPHLRQNLSLPSLRALQAEQNISW
jgi:hypothetical protein